jgi:hypothetical protein
MTKLHELEAAYYHGLREMNGMDPEVARDLGFVTNPEEFEATLESHKHINARVETREASHQANVELHHLQTDEGRNKQYTPEELAEIDSTQTAIRKSLGKTALGE